MEKETFKKDDYFKIDVEAHIWPDISDIKYYPGVKWEHVAFAGCARVLGLKIEPPSDPTAKKDIFPTVNDPDILIERMDNYGIDMACILPESGWGKTHVRPITTNGYILNACEKYPDRFIFQANVGPITARGMDHALWEAEYLVKEKNCKLIKMYPCEDTYINDRMLWPFYQKLSELKVPLSIHLGWCWVPPNLSKYCLTELLDEVATEFPELTIIAFHAGWPRYTELNMIAAVHPNVYVGLNLLLPWCITAPQRAAMIIGEAIQFAGADRVLWGTDYCNLEGQLRLAVEGWRSFQIPEDLQRGYGYTPLTEEDKAKIFGLNLATLLDIEPRRRVPEA